MADSILTRRELLRLCAMTGASYLLGGTMNAEEQLKSAETAMDHLLLGINDLDKGIEWVEKTIGVKAVIGGSHPGGGTRNALASLGDRRYLEIIAPDPEQTAYNFFIDVRKLTEPRLITWAATGLKLEDIARIGRSVGYEVFGPADGSRARPDGKTLKWKTVGILSPFGTTEVQPVPFFIEWAADSIHPSKDSPKGCQLQSLQFEHPKPIKLTEFLKRLGIQIKVKEAKEARIIATLKTPKGEVVLS